VWVLGYAWLALLAGIVALPVAILQMLLEENVMVKYDPNHNNEIYVLQHTNTGTVVLSYAEMADSAQRDAEKRKDIWTSGNSIPLTALLLLLGAGGMWWRRKLVISLARESTDKTS
jgi:hypothetical protein